MLIKFRYNDWEIPQLIHLITTALELCPQVDEFLDDNVYCVLGEGSSGDSIVILSVKSGESPLLPSPSSSLKIVVIPNFSTKKVNYLTESVSVEK